jgi:hypothetical protein
MMTISGGSCGDVGTPKQTAARVFPPTLIVPTMSVARWACPAPSASHARVSAFPSPGLVNRFARPVADRAAGVAATSPGAGHRPLEIVSPRPANPPTIVDRPRPVPAGPGLTQTSSGPDHGPARPGWNRRQATELIPS